MRCRVGAIGLVGPHRVQGTNSGWGRDMASVHGYGNFCTPNFLGKNVMSKLLGHNAWWVRVRDKFYKLLSAKPY
jgi:hypothetical protein